MNAQRTAAPLLAAGVIVLSCICDGPILAPAHAFTYLGSPATRWDLGPNRASTVAESPPNGPRRPGSATFSIMGAGFRDVSGFDPTHGSFRTSAITTLGVAGFSSEADYAAVIDWALDQWDAVSGFVNLGQVPDGNVDAGSSELVGGQFGDIRVAAWEIVSPSVIARGFQPGTEAVFGPGGTISGDVYFDVNRLWVDDPAAGSSGGYDVYTIALHEIGHALGLGHSSVAGSVMQAGYHGARRGLTADDIAGIQALYGPPEVPEPAAGVLAVLVILVLGVVGRLHWGSPTGFFRAH
jgi:hypothetical protein